MKIGPIIGLRGKSGLAPKRNAGIAVSQLQPIEIKRIRSVAEVQADLDALEVIPHQLPDAPREMHLKRMEYLDKKDELRRELDTSKDAERVGWEPSKARTGIRLSGVRVNPERIHGGGQRKTLADAVREYDTTVARLARLMVGTEYWHQTRQRAYMLRHEIKLKATKLRVGMPKLAPLYGEDGGDDET